MAIYHLSSKLVKRSEGRNAVAAAAYRSGSALYEESTGRIHDYSMKPGVAHTEILAPAGAGAWVFERERLWNTVEAHEKRWDAQVAREIEVGLPIELSQAQQVALLREFVRREFVSKGMVADFALHLDNRNNPHAHILLTTRALTADGFGLKNREWNRTAELGQWRRGWEEVTNQQLAEAGLAVRIDHRSYAEQKLALIPGRKIGLGRGRQLEAELPGYLADRIVEQQRIMGANGAQIERDPALALKALTQQQATFSHRDIARFLHTRTEDAEQFQRVNLKVTTSPELVALGVDEEGLQRFTTRDMLGLERQLLGDAQVMANRSGHGVSAGRREAVLGRSRLSEEQREAFAHVVGAGDLKCLVGVAGSGKSTALAAMREAWEAQGLTVKGAALCGIAVDNLEKAAGISSRTVASYELAWSGGRDALGAKDVLVIDEAGMLGTRQLAHVLQAATQAQAKVVLVGDPEQLQAIEAGAPFRGIAEAHGVAQLSQVRRQREGWQRQATEAFASGRTAAGLAAYEREGAIVAVGEGASARNALLTRWAYDQKQHPGSTQLVLAYTRDDVQGLNQALRTWRQQQRQLGAGEEIATSGGVKEFAVNDRVRFLRNEKAIGVKNGSLGTVERVGGGVLQVKLDGEEKSITVETKFYRHLDHGYAATVHKAQGSTVDRTYVLASAHFDRHTTYVALSRHREAATVFYAREDFGGRGGRLEDTQVRERLVERLSRARAKDLAHDYLEKPVTAVRPVVEPSVAAEKAATPAPAPTSALSTIEQQQAAGRERWLNLRAEQEAQRAAAQRQASGRAAPAESLSQAERERLAKLTAAELRAEIGRLRPAPVNQLVEQDPAVQELAQQERGLWGAAGAARLRGAQAERDAQLFRDAHPTQAKLHELGVRNSKQLGTFAKTQAEAERDALLAEAGAQRLAGLLVEVRQEVTGRITRETQPARERVEALEQLAGERAQRERIVREFRELAERRAERPAALERSAEWQAAPERLQEMIERFNQTTAQAQAEVLERMRQGHAKTQETLRTLEQDLQAQRERIVQIERQREHGIDYGPEL